MKSAILCSVVGDSRLLYTKDGRTEHFIPFLLRFVMIRVVAIWDPAFSAIAILLIVVEQIAVSVILNKLHIVPERRKRDVRLGSMNGRLREDGNGYPIGMSAFIALLLILAIFGGLGFAVHILWIVLIAALILWVVGFFFGGIAGGGRGYWSRW